MREGIGAGCEVNYLGVQGSDRQSPRSCIRGGEGRRGDEFKRELKPGSLSSQNASVVSVAFLRVAFSPETRSIKDETAAPTYPSPTLSPSTPPVFALGRDEDAAGAAAPAPGDGAAEGSAAADGAEEGAKGGDGGDGEAAPAATAGGEGDAGLSFVILSSVFCCCCCLC